MMNRKDKLALFNDWADQEELERLFSCNWGAKPMHPFHELMADYELIDGPMAYWYWCDQLDKLPLTEENDEYPKEEDVRQMFEEADRRGPISAQTLVAWFNRRVAWLIELPQRQIGLFQLLSEKTDMNELQGKDKEWMEEIKDQIHKMRRQQRTRKRRLEDE